MFDFRKKLKDSLNQAIGDASGRLESPIVFGHIFWGELSEPGSIRITEIKIHEDKSKAGLLHNLNTETAFTRHINRVGRKNTFADFLNLLFYKDKEIEADISNIFVCQIKKDAPPISYEVIGDEHHLSVSAKFTETLMPKNLLQKYVKLFLRQEPDPQNEKEYVAEQMVFCKHEALEYLTSQGEATKAQLNEIARSAPDDDYRKLDFLSAFQTALLYRAACIDQEEVGFISHSLCILKAESKKKALDNPVVLVSSLFTDIAQKDNIVKTHLGASTRIRTAITNTAYPRVAGITSKSELLKQELPRVPSFDSLYGMIGRHIRKELQIKFQPYWAQNITMWNVLLIETLRNSVHEGRNLNFTFVVADVSEVRDSGLFEVHELEFLDERNIRFHPWRLEEDEITIPYDQVGDFQAIFSEAKRNIEKKNYSWFSEGKYALLWDSAFPRKYPHSLVRVKDSSWDVVINDIRSNRPSKIHSSISLMITFVRYDQSGGLSIKENLVASFRRGGQWKYEKGDATSRDDKLRSALNNAIGKWTDTVKSDTEILRNKIYDAVMAISEDPHMGCMLIIGRKITNMFKSMGEPWRTKSAYQAGNLQHINPNALTIDEMTSLMAMDGATCLYPFNERPAISFRNSVMTSQGGRNIDEASLILDGEGSRKWSALIASSQEEVDIVIAVSQDGPIYIYESKENGEVGIQHI